MRDEREHILIEIRRLAASNGRKTPGKGTFAKETGISESQWSGRYWARWGDAVTEAGLSRNLIQAKFDSDSLLRKIAELGLENNRVPTNPMMQMRRRVDPSFPSPKTVAVHFGGHSGLVTALRNLALNETAFAGLLSVLPEAKSDQVDKRKPPKSGWVYLINYGGGEYKVGHSFTPNQRLGNLDRHTPKTLDEVFRIETDDPPGVEAYWKKRFDKQKIKNEFFELSNSDVAAFKRWRKIY